MRWSVGAKIASGFSLALVILFVVGGASHRSTNNLIETSDWVTHTHRVLESLDGAMQALTDAETGQRGYLLTGEDAYLEPYQIGIKSLDQDVATARFLTSDNPRQQRRLDILEPLLKQRQEMLKEGIDIQKAQGSEAARQWIATGKSKKSMDEIRKMIAEMTGEEKDLLQKRASDAQASAEGTKTVIVTGTISAIVMLCFVGFFLTRSISKPLRTITNIAERIAAGDLTVRLAKVSRKDEVGVLSNAFCRMVDNLRNMTRDLAQGANTLGASASQIVASSSQLASSSAQTASAVAETTATVEEVRQTAQISTQKARLVADSAQNAASISRTGKQNIEKAAEGTSRIREQMDSIAESMMRLSEQTQAIGQIITSVDDLAQQSNLLAVNASIEAAKAGEQGRGFSVVAQEVKSLSEQSKTATTQVRAILNDIQKATGAAVMATEQGTKAVEVGGTQSAQAGESIVVLTGSVTEAAQAATQIAASSQQQLIGMDQVALAMESIKQASAQNVESAKQLEGAARNIDDLGKKLKDVINQFTLSDGQLA